MNLHHFEKLLKEVNPRYRIRQRGSAPIGGVFIGDKDFIITVSRGHLPLNTFRFYYPEEKGTRERIVKRGRAEVLRILRNRGGLHYHDSVRIKHGIPAS